MVHVIEPDLVTQSVTAQADPTHERIHLRRLSAEQASLDTVAFIHWLVSGPAMHRSRGRVNTAGDLEGTD